MLFTIEIMKEKVDRGRLLPVHAGFHRLSQNAMHRIAIGDSQCVRHQLLAMLRVWMVDGESV
jgi:hypothetical protein